jgi:PAS domain-containing protein
LTFSIKGAIGVMNWEMQENKLNRRSKELEAVFDAITDIIIVVSPDLVIRDMNIAAVRSIGFSARGEIVGKSFCKTACDRKNCSRAQSEQLQCAQNRSNNYCYECQLLKAFKTGKPLSREINFFDKNYIVYLYPIFDERRSVVKVVTLLRDITAIKDRSEQ